MRIVVCMTADLNALHTEYITAILCVMNVINRRANLCA